MERKFFFPLLIILSLFSLATTEPRPAAAQSAVQTIRTNSFVEISKRVLPAVVNITIEPKGNAPDEDAMDEQLLQYFLQQQGEFDGPFLNRQVSGSGVLIGKDGDLGYVITNEHVVEALDSSENVMKLTFHFQEEGSTEYNRTTVITGDALRIIGRDKLSDLAVIEFSMPEELEKVDPIPFGDSDQLEIGEFVLALGNPLNFNHTITQGIVSGKSRNLGRGISLEKLIQTDAVIQPGNSGGPLVNLDGAIVGINTAIVSRTGLWQGTSFAIPSNDAKRIADDLIGKGRVQRGYLGITMQDVRQHRDLPDRYGLDVPMGVYVVYVVPDSPADIAGIHRFDVITGIDDVRVTSPDHLLREITARPINGTIGLGVVRLGEDDSPISLDMVANLSERPNESVILDLHRASPEDMIIPMIPEEGSEIKNLIGIDVEEYMKLDTKGRVSGLRVIDLRKDGPADRAGLEKGDIITRLNGRAVRTQSDFKSALARADTEHIELKVTREDGNVLTIAVPNPGHDED